MTPENEKVKHLPAWVITKLLAKEPLDSHELNFEQHFKACTNCQEKIANLSEDPAAFLSRFPTFNSLHKIYGQEIQVGEITEIAGKDDRVERDENKFSWFGKNFQTLITKLFPVPRPILAFAVLTIMSTSSVLFYFESKKSSYSSEWSSKGKGGILLKIGSQSYDGGQKISCKSGDTLLFINNELKKPYHQVWFRDDQGPFENYFTISNIKSDQKQDTKGILDSVIILDENWTKETIYVFSSAKPLTQVQTLGHLNSLSEETPNQIAMGNNHEIELLIFHLDKLP